MTGQASRRETRQTRLPSAIPRRYPPAGQSRPENGVTKRGSEFGEREGNARERVAVKDKLPVHDEESAYAGSEEGEGWLGALAPLHAELLAGVLRLF